MKFKLGDKVNCIAEEDGYANWINATVVEVREEGTFPYTCVCDHYGSEEGDFSEEELELVSGQ